MKSLFRRNFNYEEDDFDRLENIYKNKNRNKEFTSKKSIKTREFDYEEDPYEPDLDYEE